MKLRRLWIEFLLWRLSNQYTQLDIDLVCGTRGMSKSLDYSAYKVRKDKLSKKHIILLERLKDLQQ